MIRGSGLLVAVVVVGAPGLLAFAPGGPLSSLVDALGSGSTVAPSVQSDGADGTTATVTGGVPGRPADAVEMTVEHVHDGDTLFLRADQPNVLAPTTDSVKVA